MTSAEFEQQVARIVRALSASEATTKVTWDARIPDPDNPDRLRQVDITIERGSDVTFVECRHRKGREDVQWIEELYGRKKSLGADAIIGVSSTGFTAGAIAKAARLGVFLRTLVEIAEEEIASWGARTKVRVTFAQIRRIRLAVVVSDRIAVTTAPDALRTDTGGAFPIMSPVSEIARQLYGSSAPEGNFVIQLILSRTFLGMTPVSEALLSFEWKRIHREVALPVLLAYHEIERQGNEIGAIVEKNHHNETEMCHAPSGGVLVIDLSTMPFEECCVLTGAEGVFSGPTSVHALEVIGPPTRLEVIQYQVSTITRSNPHYQRLMNDARSLKLSDIAPAR
jgi:hypothetical protein